MPRFTRWCRRIWLVAEQCSCMETEFRTQFPLTPNPLPIRWGEEQNFPVCVHVVAQSSSSLLGGMRVSLDSRRATGRDSRNPPPRKLSGLRYPDLGRRTVKAAPAPGRLAASILPP